MITVSNRHYAAGLFEGEGTVCMNRRSVHAAVVMTDLEPLQRFQEAVGTGNITGPYQHGPGKPRWAWKVGSWAEVHHLGKMLYPLLSPRRQEQFERVLSQYAPQRPGQMKPLPETAGDYRF